MICVKFTAFCDLWIRLATHQVRTQVLVSQTCVDLPVDLRVRLATLRKSIRKFWFRKLALTCLDLRVRLASGLKTGKRFLSNVFLVLTFSFSLSISFCSYFIRAVAANGPLRLEYLRRKNTHCLRKLNSRFYSDYRASYPAKKKDYHNDKYANVKNVYVIPYISVEISEIDYVVLESSFSNLN